MFTFIIRVKINARKSFKTNFFGLLQREWVSYNFWKIVTQKTRFSETKYTLMAKKSNRIVLSCKSR